MRGKGEEKKEQCREGGKKSAEKFPTIHIQGDTRKGGGKRERKKRRGGGKRKGGKGVERIAGKEYRLSRAGGLLLKRKKRGKGGGKRGSRKGKREREGGMHIPFQNNFEVDAGGGREGGERGGNVLEGREGSAPRDFCSQLRERWNNRGKKKRKGERGREMYLEKKKGMGGEKQEIRYPFMFFLSRGGRRKEGRKRGGARHRGTLSRR